MRKVKMPSPETIGQSLDQGCPYIPHLLPGNL